MDGFESVGHDCAGMGGFLFEVPVEEELDVEVGEVDVAEEGKVAFGAFAKAGELTSKGLLEEEAWWVAVGFFVDEDFGYMA